MDLTVVGNSILYALLGILLFTISFYVVDKLTPGDLWQELIEKKNVAIAIVAGFAVLGICIIIAAAIH